jgi:hypothetical protein
MQGVRAVHAKSNLNEESKIDREISKFLPLQNNPAHRIDSSSFTSTRSPGMLKWLALNVSKGSHGNLLAFFLTMPLA